MLHRKSVPYNEFTQIHWCELSRADCPDRVEPDEA